MLMSVIRTGRVSGVVWAGLSSMFRITSFKSLIWYRSDRRSSIFGSSLTVGGLADARSSPNVALNVDTSKSVAIGSSQIKRMGRTKSLCEAQAGQHTHRCSFSRTQMGQLASKDFELWTLSFETEFLSQLRPTPCSDRSLM